MKQVKYIILILLLFCATLKTNAETFYSNNFNNIYSSTSSNYELKSPAQIKFVAPHEQRILSTSQDKKSDFFGNNNAKTPVIFDIQKCLACSISQTFLINNNNFFDNTFLSEIKIHAP